MELKSTPNINPTDCDGAQSNHSAVRIIVRIVITIIVMIAAI